MNVNSNKKVEFRVNDFLILRLENGRTNIYVNDILFMHCKSLFLINPHERTGQTEINSIDEAKERLSSKLEGRITPSELGLTPEEEFFGHCSNIQAWTENNYDTRILHSNIAFPLLKKLTKVGDIKEKKVFKEEIAKRIMSGHLPAINYLFSENFLDFLEVEEIKCLISEYERLAHSSNVNHKKIWNIIALLYHSADDFKNSEKYFMLALNFDKSAKNILHNLADLYRYNEFYNKAEKIYKNILERHPNDYIAKNHLAYVYVFGGEFDKAINIHLQMLEIDSDDHFILNNIGLAYRKKGQKEKEGGSFKKAEGSFKKAEGSFKKAEDSFKKALEIDPFLLQSLRNLGDLYFKKNLFSDSLFYFNKIITIDDECANDWCRKGEALFKLNQYDDAGLCYDKALELDSNCERAWYDKALILAFKCEEEKALEFLEMAIKLDIKCKTMAKDDIDFDNLKNNKGFRGLVGQRKIKRIKSFIKRVIFRNRD